MHVAIGNEWQGTRRCLLQLADDIIPRKIDQEDLFFGGGAQQYPNTYEKIFKKYSNHIYMEHAVEKL